MKKEVRNKLIYSIILSSLFSLVIILLNVNYIVYTSLTLGLVLLFELVLPKRQDYFVTFLLTVLLIYLNSYIIVSTIVLSLLMFFIPAFYFRNKENIMRELGFNGSVVRAFIISIISLVPLFFLYMLLVLFSFHLGLNDSHNVVDKVLDLPVYLMVYAVLLAPFVEEVFFRSFLVTFFKRFVNSEIVCSLFSTLLFSLAHLSYGSIFEIMGTFFMGYALYVTFRLSKDIKVPIFIHMIINFTSLTLMHLVV